MTDKPIIYYKKDCFNEPYCSLGKVIEQLDQLKKENDECIKDNEYLKTIIKDFTQEVVSLKMILAEIKGICRFNFTMTTTNLLAKTILQKISEVENEN